jgi:hypothetical protein
MGRRLLDTRSYWAGRTASLLIPASRDNYRRQRIDYMNDYYRHVLHKEPPAYIIDKALDDVLLTKDHEAEEYWHAINGDRRDGILILPPPINRDAIETEVKKS